MAGLATYRAKRNFKVTDEPAGSDGAAQAKAGGLFVIHMHAARRLHYDLRLEHDGVLWSWAVTRGPSLDPAEKRLAVHVEDHPLDYGSFEGAIPKGEYGGGEVLLWDQGTWTPEFDPEFGMRKGHIEFKLKGEKLHGLWHLVRLKPRGKERTENWLLIKSDNEFARPGEDILEEAPLSVKTGRSIEEIAAGKPAKKRAAKPAPGKKRVAKKGKGKASPMPGFIAPSLATLRSGPPSGDEWVHEVKFDGYRTQARLDQGKVTLFTRAGLDWTHRFGKAIPKAIAALDAGGAVIDGEMVVMSDTGSTSFSALQAALSEGKPERIRFFAFDLLFLDGEDLRAEALSERKDRLRELLGPDAPASPLRFSEHFVEPGKTFLAHACRMGLEGVVSKRADAPYRSGRIFEWVKTKCKLRQEFVIVGYVPSQATGRGLRSLLVGVNEDAEIRPAGRVGTGFSSRTAGDLLERLAALKTPKSAFKGLPGREKGIVWVEPKLVAEVEFGAWTADRIMRHASFQGLREDKPAEEVVVELPADAPENAPGAAAKASPDRPKTSERLSRAIRKASTLPKVKTSVTLSNAQKLLWPDAGVTKQGLLDHYAQVWPRMEPYVVNRPLSLVRAPDGIEGKQRFFQKHASPGMHEAIARIPDPEDGTDLLFIRDFDGLAALVQMGVVEIHIWGSTIDKVEQPDQIVFDLDPDEGLDAADVRAAAFDIKARLDALELPTLVKTSGGKGYHVVIPLKPNAGWDEVKDFAHDFARAMEQAEPKRYTATLSKKARKGRIFLDYLRNGRGSTTIAPWSSRAKPKATVSVPVTWEALEKGVAPDAFTMGDAEIAKALRAPDPWADIDKLRKRNSIRAK